MCVHLKCEIGSYTMQLNISSQKREPLIKITGYTEESCS